MRPNRLWIVTLALVAAGLVPGVALGHADLVGSDPRDGSTVPAEGGTITATFSEGIDPGRSSLLLVASSGEIVASGAVDPSGTTMTLRYRALAPGTYTVRWTSVTTDDNGVERGTFSLVAVAGSTASQGASPSPGSSADAAPPDQAAPSSAGAGGGVDLAIALAVVALVALAVLSLVRRRRAS